MQLDDGTGPERQVLGAQRAIAHVGEQ